MCSCVEVREPIELLFGVVSGVDLGIRVLDMGLGAPRARGSFGSFSAQWFEWCIFCTEMYLTRA